MSQSNINASKLLAMPIPLPPFSEQKRIVAKVEELLTRVNAARERLARVPSILKRFRQAVLAAACSGWLTPDVASTDEQLPSGWTTVSLSALVQTLQQGWSPRCEIDPSPSPAVWGVIKTTAVQALSFIEGENKRLPEYLSPRKDLELREGDLLITRAGPRVRAGVCCLVRAIRPRLIICDKVYRFRVRESLVLAEYVELALNAPKMIELIDTLKTGISDSGVNLTQDKFLALEIPLPPLPEQHAIVRRVEALFKLADAIEKRVATARQRTDKLTQAILAKAFRGELVPTEAELARAEGRDYEPASALLERIRSERQEKETASKEERKPRRRAKKMR